MSMKTALLFSGQGAQKVGMGKDLYESSPTARALYDKADEILGWKLTELCFNGPEEALTETKVCQPALFVHGFVVHALMQEAGLIEDASVAMGLSLGEVTSLAVAGVFDFETGLRVVAERGRLMQEACEQTDGSMASIIGVERDVVAAFCEEHDVQMANLNCPGQIVISGESEKIAAAVEEGVKRGFRRVIPLKVAGAYHSRLMEPARQKFEDFLKTIEFSKPNCRVLTNTTGKEVEEPDMIRQALVNQVVSSVLWEDCMSRAAELGVENFVELGVGRVLRGMVKRTNKQWENASFETWAEINSSEAVIA